jgi:TRAP-type C4-dicarboxylate transport system substrate-binding protein
VPVDCSGPEGSDGFDAKLKEKGFYVSGWGDVGIARTMSKGFAVKVPADLKGKRPAVISDDSIGPKVYAAMGVTPVPGSVTEFLPMLNSGAINVMTTPSIAAEQLQWASRLDHINDAVVGFGVGALVMSESQLEDLGKEHRKTLEALGKIANKELLRTIRQEDEDAFKRRKKVMKVHNQTTAEREQWEAVWNKACEQVKPALQAVKVLQTIGNCGKSKKK